MAKFYDNITPYIEEFIHKQHVFFVATAPLSGAGHINLSPKGLDSFRILTSNKVAYLDMTGSGNETSAHIAENGRVTFMFCSFEGPCDIIRLYGVGRTVLPGDAEWAELIPRFTQTLGQRQIIVADIHRTQTSCGYAVPLFDYVGDRDTLDKWCENKGEEALIEYRSQKNARSLDDLPTPLGQRLQS